MLLYKRTRKTYDFYTVKADVGKIRVYKEEMLRQQQDPLFYVLTTYNPSAACKVIVGQSIDSWEIDLERPLDEFCQPSGIQEMEINYQSKAITQYLVNQQNMIMESYLNGEYDGKIPSAITGIPILDESYLLKTQEVKTNIDPSANKEYYIFYNLMKLSRPLYALQLFLAEKFDQLENQNVEAFKDLFTVEYSHFRLKKIFGIVLKIEMSQELIWTL